MNSRLVPTLLACAACGAYLLWRSYIPPGAAFKRLIGGDNQVRIEALVLEANHKSVVINDPALTEYLTNAFRSAWRPSANKFGSSYTGYIRFSTGGSVQCSIAIPAERGFLTVSEPTGIWIDDPLTYYLITLPEPIPEALDQILAGLR